MRLSVWLKHKSAIKAVNLIGCGTGSSPVWNGVPVLSVGVRTNADILKSVSFRNLQVVKTVLNGLRT